MKKTYSIKEVAKLLNIGTNKIRFYEKKGLIHPQRGAENDYRYFTEEEIIKLQTILLYRGIGFSVQEIDSLLQKEDKANYLKHFYNQWEMVNNQIQQLTQTRVALEHIMDQMYLATEEDCNTQLLEEIQQNVEKIQIKNSWKDCWDFNSWANHYDEDVRTNQGSLRIYENYEKVLELVVKQTEKAMNKEMGKESKLLDIGVGTGNLASKFLRKGYDITGVDQSRAMLEVAKSKQPSLKVRLGEFMKLPFESHSMDAIVSSYAFHHLKENEKKLALEEMQRVLKEDGIIVIGDLMFENQSKKEEFVKGLTEEERDIVEDEYYADIEKLKGYTKEYGRKLEAVQIDRLCWVVVIK